MRLRWAYLWAGRRARKPDPDNAPKAPNPANRQQPTPQQRQAQREKQRQRQMQRQLARVGVSDAAQQQAVANYIESETQARQKLQQSSRALATALRGDAITDQQVAILLHDYNVAVDDDRARRVAAQKKLSDEVDLLQKPRLQAFLTLMGLYGDGPDVGGGNWRRGR